MGRKSSMNISINQPFFEISPAEEDLLKVGHLALLSMQLPGYFPVKVTSVPGPQKGQPSHSSFINDIGISNTIQPLRLPFDMESINSFILSLCFSTALLLSVATSAFSSFKLYEAVERVVGVEDKKYFSDTGDKFVVTYLFFCSLIVFTFCRFLILQKRQKLISFWNQKLVRINEDFSRLNLSQYLIPSTKGQVKGLCIYFWAISVIQFGCAVIYMYIQKYLFSGKSMEDHETIDFDSLILLVILFLLYAHSGPVIWTGFMMEFYCNCFKVIANEMKKVNAKIFQDTGEREGRGRSFYDRTYGIVSVLRVSTIGREWKEKANVKANLYKKCAEELHHLIELYEQVGEAVECFNNIYGVIVLIDVFVGLTNALGFVYTVNMLMYELGDHSMAQNMLILFRIPFYLSQVLRVIYFTNKGSLLADHGLNVLRNLHKVPICLFANKKSLLYVKIQMLVTRLSINPPRLCPANFFTLNRMLLASLFSFLGTYYIVLTEYREEDEGRRFIRNLNFSCGSHY